MSETNIAKENVKTLNSIWIPNSKAFCKAHFEFCQRFLKFIEEKVTWGYKSIEVFEDKVDDLQNAIKVYENLENRARDLECEFKLIEERKRLIHEFRSSGIDFLEFCEELANQDKTFIRLLKGDLKVKMLKRFGMAGGMSAMKICLEVIENRTGDLK